MKILLLAEACGAGVGRHVIDLAHGLSAADHEVHLIYSTLRIDRAFVKGFNSLRAAHAGIRCTAVPMRRGPHPSDLVCGWRLRKYVRRHGPFDAIHAHSTKAGLLARTALAGLPGARIYTPHAPLTMNPDLKQWARSLLARYERSLARFTRSIIAVSPEELSHLQACGIPEEKLVLVPNGINMHALGQRGLPRFGSAGLYRICRASRAAEKSAAAVPGFRRSVAQGAAARRALDCRCGPNESFTRGSSRATRDCLKGPLARGM